MDLVSSVPEFRNHILWKHPGIASGDIDIQIGDLDQTKQYIDKTDPVSFQIGIIDLLHVLDLIDQNIILFLIFNPASDIPIKFKRIAVSGIDTVI